MATQSSSPRAETYWRILGAAVVLSPLALFGVIWAVPSLDPLIMAADFHFYVVSFTALAAAIACGVIIASARTLNETRLLFLGLAFFAIAGIFSVHGLTTPGYIVDEFYYSVAISGWFSAAVGCAFAALSVAPLPPKLDHAIERNGKAIFAIAAALVAGYIAMSVYVEDWLDWVPIDNRNIDYIFGFPALALVGFAAWRYWQSYQFARLPAQLAMVATLTLLLEVQVIILWGQVWHLSWWLYHGVYLAAFCALFFGWALEVSRAGSLRAIADALSMRDALAQLNRGLETPIVELADAIEVKDIGTFGHVRRVSTYALHIGRRLGLSPADLRSLVLAAEMHDVGKIGVPDAILGKRGPLTDEEYGVIKLHAHRGDSIARQVPALHSLAPVIRAHHERMDGSGYPDGLAGEQIPLLARIVAVADTYDALTSKRPYRDASSQQDAIAELIRCRGTLFDPTCIDAFVAEMSESDLKAA